MLEHIKKDTEINATVKQRVGQDALRKELLEIYSGRCAILTNLNY